MQPVTTPRPETDSTTRHAILEAARERYLRFGARKTTVNEIANEAGCSRATVYLHFPNKRAVYEGLLIADYEAFLARAERELSGERDARRALRRMTELARETFARNAVLRAALEGDQEMTIEPVAREVTASMEVHVIALLRTVLVRGVEQGLLRPVDPDRVAYLMYHLGNFLVTRETSGTADYPLHEMLALMDDVFARGIAAEGGTP